MNLEQYWAEVHEADGARWEGSPHGWIQWKGTNVCIDLHCCCGAHGHIDAEFFYNYVCLACGRKYSMSAYVRMIELTPEQAELVENKHGGFSCDPDTRDDESETSKPEDNP
jgi:hypothetical protein